MQAQTLYSQLVALSIGTSTHCYFYAVSALFQAKPTVFSRSTIRYIEFVGARFFAMLNSFSERELLVFIFSIFFGNS